MQTPASAAESVTVKLLVTGPFSAGKTTLISAISEIPVVATEAAVSDHTIVTKANTTVTMDFGKLTVEGEGLHAELLMFGTPGQDRFSFMWDVLAKGMDGYVLMVDLSSRESVEEAGKILRYFREMSGAPFVVGANRALDNPDALESLDIDLALQPGAVVVPCEATDRDSAKQVVLALLLEVLTFVEDEASVGAE